MTNIIKQLILVFLVASICIPFSGPLSKGMAAESCPQILAGLMPKNAVKVTGQYMPSDMISMGSASADLPFTNICSNQTTKYPGHLTLEVQHYKGDAVQMLRMQVDSVEQQTLQGKKSEFEKILKGIRGPNSKALSVSDLKTEKVSGGTIIYFDYYIDCSEGEKRSKPSTRLTGVAHTDSTRITLNIDGFISAEAARAAAVEVLTNFSKARF
jgi:hypothetical protein